MEAIMADTRTDEEKKQAFLALAQAQFSDIEDLPEYGLFPNGTYVFDVTDAQIDADAGALKQTLALVEVSELENPDTPPEEIPAPGTLLGPGSGEGAGCQWSQRVCRSGSGRQVAGYSQADQAQEQGHWRHSCQQRSGDGCTRTLIYPPLNPVATRLVPWSTGLLVPLPRKTSIF
jgi:hypothetical protein